MPPEDPSDPEALQSLDQRLEAFEAGRRAQSSPINMGWATSDAYRVLGRMLGGVFGGVGLGWWFDKFARTAPLGLLVGLFLGVTITIVSLVRDATRGAATQESKDGKT